MAVDFAAHSPPDSTAGFEIKMPLDTIRAAHPSIGENGIDLYDPQTIEALVRNPHAFLVGGKFQPPPIEQRLHNIPQAHRSYFLVEERRAAHRNERARLDKYIQFLKANNAWMGMDVHFPHLQPDQIVHDVAHFWVNGDVALNWSEGYETTTSSYGSFRSSPTTIFSAHYSPRSTTHTRQSSINTTCTMSSHRELFHHAEFSPSLELLDQPKGITIDLRRRIMDAGLDPDNMAYRGEVNQSFIENKFCPDEYNCSVYFTNVDPNASDKEIFALVHEGGISKYSKKPPYNGEKGYYPNCAVTLAFKEPHAAKSFLMRCNGDMGIWLRGLRLKAAANRDHVRPCQPSKMYQSRIIAITAPRSKMTAEGVEAFFHTKIKFNLVDRHEWIEPNGDLTIQFEFTSIEGRSRAAIRCFLVEAGKCGEQNMYNVRYIPDYCDPASGESWNGNY